jgi:hypothetical protein
MTAMRGDSLILSAEPSRPLHETPARDGWAVYAAKARHAGRYGIERCGLGVRAGMGIA